MSKSLLRLVVLLWMGVLGAVPLDAQTDAGTAAVSPDLADTIRKAAESGVSVIVVDGSGKLLSVPAATSQPAPGDATGSDSSGSMLLHAQSEVDAFIAALRARIDNLPVAVNEVLYILRATSPDGRIMTYVEVLLWNMLLFGAGLLAMREIYAKRIAKRFVVARVEDNPEGYRGKMPFLVYRFFMGMVGTVFAMVVAYLLGLIFFGRIADLSVKLTVTSLFVGFFMIRTVSDLWRMVLSPFLSQYRIPDFSDHDARRLFQWARILAAYDISAVIFATWVGDFGLNYDVYAIVYGVLSLVGVIGNAAMILFNAGAISNAIRSGRTPTQVSFILRFLSFVWAPALMVYLAVSWMELAFDLVLQRPVSIPLAAGSYGILLSIIVVYGLVNYGIETVFLRSREVERLRDEHSAAEAVEEDFVAEPKVHPIATYEDLARRVAGILAFVAGTYALVNIWNPENTIIEDSFLGRTLDVIAIVFIGYVVYHLFRIWIDSRIAEEIVDAREGELGDEGMATGASRLATLLPLFRGAILAVVVVSITLIALMELGINVSPLFAGAGVVGLAVGFGAQTLVRDIFSGAFFLIDDAFRKGEYVDLGSVKGTVEKISVRSMQLRHHLGALNTIPFGEIKVLTNFSRDWVIMKLPLRVTYDTDVEKVRKLIKKLGQELLEDPVIGANFIQPLKSQGVIEMQDSAMIIRVKFMTKPGDQWLVRKKVYEEIRERFAKEGIKFAHREVTVRLADGDPKDLTQQQREAVAGAVQRTIDEDDFSDMPAGGDDR